MVLEAVTEQSLEKLTQLMLALWPECYFDEELDNNRQLLESNKDLVLLSKKDNQYTGFIHVSLRYDYVEGTDSSPVGYVEGLYVVPEDRKTGTGQQLINAGAQWAKGSGCTEIASDAELQNLASIDFHKSVGFEEINRIVCFVKKID